MCLILVRGISRVHRWSRRCWWEDGAPDADTVIRPLRLVAYALSRFAECPEYTGGLGKVAGRGTGARSQEMGGGWPYWSSRCWCRYLQLISRWLGGCWLVGVVLGLTWGPVRSLPRGAGGWLVKSPGPRGSDIDGSAAVTDTGWPLGLCWVGGRMLLAYFPLSLDSGVGWFPNSLQGGIWATSVPI